MIYCNAHFKNMTLFFFAKTYFLSFQFLALIIQFYSLFSSSSSLSCWYILTLFTVVTFRKNEKTSIYCNLIFFLYIAAWFFFNSRNSSCFVVSFFIKGCDHMSGFASTFLKYGGHTKPNYIYSTVMESRSVASLYRMQVFPPSSV